MANQLLLQLLIKITDAVEKRTSEEIPEKVFEYFSSTLGADACALYLQKLEHIVLVGQMNADADFSFADVWGGEVLPSKLAGYEDQESINQIFPEAPWQSCFFLPIKVGEKLIGVLVAGWQQYVPLDSWIEKNLSILQCIGHLLGNSLYAETEIQRLKLREGTLERICKQAIDELENNKKQLSRELHDEVGQAMTSILLQLKLLQQEQDLELIHDRLGGLRYITQQTIEDVRRISMNLRPAVLENLGLVPALDWYIEDYRRYSGITTDFSSPRIKERLPGEIEIIIYRAVQESLTNVARHAKASHVFVTLNYNEGCLELQVADNGKGMNLGDVNSGLGLLGMEERVKLARGEFTIKSKPEQGTTILMTLPLTKESRNDG
ncbi:sensor histidine kinase [Desulfosporosinus sp.]|uniref:GAF domain-containing sensor histidine kinase n=1 Tax=Desulfosporosinus sp. TaxID=157907 RepID=UPI0025BC4507|nr:sensor histidine kinase [Desulfosporosinus sp.]MBC2721705.1 sensor histidine kinase [Desulfosporosinus sp.]MBC2728142.1 sensor histidine kinase [Desulfosporosinus sp.]